MSPAPDVALGLDIGGSSTRALVVGSDGTRHGSGRAPGANLTSHSAESGLAAVAAALSAALRGLDPARVRAAVIGTAGPKNLAVPEIAAALDRIWLDAGLGCGYEVVADATVAFVAGTGDPDGTLVLSGTGALVARVEHRRLAQIVDGHGWLLGDQGSGFWLGREAVRRTLRALDRRVEPGPLGQAVLHRLVGTTPTGSARDVSAELVFTVHRRLPVALAELAPLVTAAAGADPVADDILDLAAGHLVEETEIVRRLGDGTVVVLAGSLLSTDTPLARRVRRGLTTRWPGAAIAVAHDAAAGAAWLGLSRSGTLDSEQATALHSRLFGRPA
jgi:N-acetylglucosamine kinase-like BadF-type ATPase